MIPFRGDLISSIGVNYHQHKKKTKQYIINALLNLMFSLKNFTNISGRSVDVVQERDQQT